MKSDEAVTILDYRIDDPTRRYLVYSKTVKDRLPITKTHFGLQPCIDHEKISSDRTFYPTEIDRAKVCEDEKGNILLDQRYQLVGESISVFDH